MTSVGSTVAARRRHHDRRSFQARSVRSGLPSKHAAVDADCDACVSPLARNTVKNIAATLRAILYQAQVDELIPSNPAARFGKLFDFRRDARKDVTVLEPADVAAVLDAGAKWYSDHELAVATLFYTGMREGELLGLQWDDFDFGRGMIDLRRTVSIGHGGKGRGLIVRTPKSGKIRTVDLASGLTARFKDLYSIRQTEAAVSGEPVSPW